MTRKKIMSATALVFFLTVIGLLVDFGTQDITAQEDSVHGESDTQLVHEVYTDVIKELDDNNVDYAIKLILDNSPKDFFTGYAVDESFLCWLNKRYDKNVILDIAYNVYQGNYDSNLWHEYTGETMHVLWLRYCSDLKYSTYSLNNTLWFDDANTEDGITLDFIGDIVFSDDWCTMQHASQVGGVTNCFSDEIKAELNSADVTLANNEFTYSNDGQPLVGKDYIFKSKTENVKYLSDLGVDMVSLANNHIYDCGAEGVISSLETLEEAGITTVGAGRNFEEASAIKYICIGGQKIAIVAATEIEKYSNFTKEASVDSPGVLKTLNSDRYCTVIREAEANSDLVIAFVHWGTEGTDYYDYDQTRLAKDFAEAGADVIIGGHPHRLQGISYMQGVPVIYSLGNFWLSNGSQYTTIAQVKISGKGKADVRMIPCLQKNEEVSMITDQTAKKSFYEYLTEVSINVGYDSDGNVYNLSRKKNRKLQSIVYKAGAEFDKHDCYVDLDGRPIDSIGNLR